MSSDRPALFLCLAVFLVLSLALLAFSLTLAPPWNEGFHFLAAQLILAGKRPYLDFFYQHPPLYAYLNAGWMRLFGETWRSANALAALATAGTILLVGQFVLSRLDDPRWRWAAALAAALLTGLHTLVIRFGAIGQPYALCLLATVAAYRLTLASVERRTRWLPAGAGLASGAAAASWLLAAPAAPILLFWMARHSRPGQAEMPVTTGSRAANCGWFLTGLTIPFLPLLWLAARDPRLVFFNVVEYHLLYRREQPGEYWKHDLRVLTSWLDSPQALLLALLAAAGLAFFTAPAGRARRPAELRLCLWLAAGLALLAAVASPTFSGYFILLVPFLSILAAAGLYAIGVRLWAPRHPAWLVLAVLGLFTLGAAKWYYGYRAGFGTGWASFETVARRVNQVTPENALLYADPEIYFTARRLPPAGLENIFSRFLPETVAESRGLAPASRIRQWLGDGRFATVVMVAGDRQAGELGLSRLYARHERLQGFDIFWDRLSP